MKGLRLSYKQALGLGALCSFTVTIAWVLTLFLLSKTPVVKRKDALKKQLIVVETAAFHFRTQATRVRHFLEEGQLDSVAKYYPVYDSVYQRYRKQLHIYDSLAGYMKSR